MDRKMPAEGFSEADVVIRLNFHNKAKNYNSRQKQSLMPNKTIHEVY